MATVEQLEPPSPRRRFAYWGPHAALKLSEDLPAVILEYVTEPPHGDPLYKLTIGGITVGGRKRPLLFFGRDIHLITMLALPWDYESWTREPFSRRRFGGAQALESSGFCSDRRGFSS